MKLKGVNSKETPLPGYGFLCSLEIVTNLKIASILDNCARRRGNDCDDCEVSKKCRNLYDKYYSSHPYFVIKRKSKDET